MSQSTSKLTTRVQRRTLEELEKLTHHLMRTGGDLRHVDPKRTHLNRAIVGTGNFSRDVHAAYAKIAAKNLANELPALRKARGKKAEEKRAAEGPKAPYHHLNQKPWTEILITASPEHFRPNGEGPGEWDPERVEAFAKRTHKVLKKKFGRGLVSLLLELDEEIPHLTAAVLPLVATRSKRRGRQEEVNHRAHPEFFIPDVPDEDLVDCSGAPLKGQERRAKRLELQEDLIKGYETFQDSMAKRFKGLGLVRGERHAERRRVDRFLGERPEPAPVHRGTKEWRRDQGAELERQKAVTEQLQTELRAAQAANWHAEQSQAAAAKAEAKAAQRAEAAEAKLAEAEALKTGFEAIMAEELLYRPGDRTSGTDGVEASKELPPEKAQDLLNAIRPAFTGVTAFAKRVAELTGGLRSKMLASFAARGAAATRREEDIEVREAAVRGAETRVLTAAAGVEHERAELEQREPKELTMSDIARQVASGLWRAPSEAEQADRLREMSDVFVATATRSTEERASQDDRLAKLTNRGLRQHYCATESASSLLDVSTAETNPATRRRKTRPVAGCQAPWRARSPDSWRVPWRIGPQGQFCDGCSDGGVCLASAALTEPIAVAVHLEDVDVVGQPIKECACKAFGAECFGPFVEWHVWMYMDPALLQQSA